MFLAESAFQAALETIADGINQGTPAGAVLAASVFRDDAVLIGPGINVITNKAGGLYTNAHNIPTTHCDRHAIILT